MPPRIDAFDVARLCSSVRPLEISLALAHRRYRMHTGNHVRSPTPKLYPLGPSNHDLGLERCTTLHLLAAGLQHQYLTHHLPRT